MINADPFLTLYKTSANETFLSRPLKTLVEIQLVFFLYFLTAPCVVCRNFQIAHSCEMETRFIKIYELINNGEKLREGACP